MGLRSGPLHSFEVLRRKKLHYFLGFMTRGTILHEDKIILNPEVNSILMLHPNNVVHNVGMSRTYDE